MKESREHVDGFHNAEKFAYFWEIIRIVMVLKGYHVVL